MEEAEINRVIELSGFTRSRLPFTYLGVPINCKKLLIEEGKGLIETMTTRIRQWSTRHLSYAGRIVLINSVLMVVDQRQIDEIHGNNRW